MFLHWLRHCVYSGGREVAGSDSISFKSKGHPKRGVKSTDPELKKSESREDWPEQMARRDRGLGRDTRRLWPVYLEPTVPEIESRKGGEWQTQTHSQKRRYPGCRALARTARQVARYLDPQQQQTYGRKTGEETTGKATQPASPRAAFWLSTSSRT